MKKMKRLLALVLALAMALSFAVTTSFAEDSSEDTNTITLVEETTTAMASTYSTEGGESGGETDEPVEIPTVVAGEDEASVSGSSQELNFDSYTVEKDGTLTIEMTQLICFDQYAYDTAVEENGSADEADYWVDSTAYIASFLGRGQYKLIINGETYQVSPVEIEVKAGDVVTVSLENYYSNNVQAKIKYTLEVVEEEETPAEPETIEGTASVGTYDYEKVTWTAPADGVLTVTASGDPGCAFKYIFEGIESYQMNAKTKTPMDFTVYEGDVYEFWFKAYDYSGWEGVAGTINYTLEYTPAEVEERVVELAEYKISDQKITSTGDWTIDMLNDAAYTTIVTIALDDEDYTTDEELGVYEISVDGTKALIANLGAGSWYIYDWNSEGHEASDKLEWTCQEAPTMETDTILDENYSEIEITRINEGQAMMLGIQSEDDTVVVTVNKVGEYVPNVVELQTYVNKHNVTNFTIPEGYKAGEYVDVTGETVHTAVLGDDGYYHLDSADGDILLVDMDYLAVLTDALTDGRGVMYAYVTDENGTILEKWDIGNACSEYYNSTDKNGYYPLTEDLIFFYDTYAAGNGVYSYVFPDGYNEECAWMFACITMVKEGEEGGGDETDATELYDGDNEFDVGSYFYTATETGTLYYTIDSYYYDYGYGLVEGTDWIDSDIEDGAITLTVNGTAVDSASGSVEVTEGDKVTFAFSTTKSWTFDMNLNLGYDGEGQEDVDPIWLYTSDCPYTTDAIEAGKTLPYVAYGWNGYNMTVTGEGAYVIVETYDYWTDSTVETRYDAVDGVVTVPMDSYWIDFKVGNDGSEAASFVIDCYGPEGSYYNPAELQMGENVAEIAQNGGYYYTWTAVDCNYELTISIDTEKCDDWYFGYDLTLADGSFEWGSSSYSSGEGDEGVSEYVVSLNKGDTIDILVMTDSYQAGTVYLDASAEYNHTVVVDEAVEATCTEDGLTEGSHCSVCGEVIVAQEVVPATGHTEVADEAVEATCTETGLTEGSHCSVCDKVIVAQEVVPAKGHTEVVDEAVEATCTETGLTEGKHCSVCGEVIVAQEVVAAKGHDLKKVEAKQATTEAEGNIEYYVCENCGKWYADAEGKVEITDKSSVVTPKVVVEDKTDDATTGSTTENKDNSPKTGDTAPVLMMATLAVLAAGAFIVLTKKRRA